MRSPPFHNFWPQLLELLALEGAMVTLDTPLVLGGCQRAICQQIIDSKVDYVIGLKGNQGSLHDDVELFFKEHDAREIGEGFVHQSQTLDGDHGRIEERRYTVCTHIDWLVERHQWPGLKSIVMVECRRQIRGEMSKFKTILHLFTC